MQWFLFTFFKLSSYKYYLINFSYIQEYHFRIEYIDVIYVCADNDDISDNYEVITKSYLKSYVKMLAYYHINFNLSRCNQYGDLKVVGCFMWSIVLTFCTRNCLFSSKDKQGNLGQSATKGKSETIYFLSIISLSQQL